MQLLCFLDIIHPFFNGILETGFCLLSLGIGTSSIDWAQLSRFLPEDRDRIQSPKCRFK
jgi:hypothetical protein